MDIEDKKYIFIKKPVYTIYIIHLILTFLALIWGWFSFEKMEYQLIIGYGIYEYFKCGGSFGASICQLVISVATALKVFFYPLIALLETFPVLLKP